MYDNLWEEDPYLQKWVEKRAEKRAEALVEKRAQNKFRETIMSLVRERFPALQTIVEQKIAAIDDADALQRVIVTLAVASDEVVARQYVATLEPVHAAEMQ